MASRPYRKHILELGTLSLKGNKGYIKPLGLAWGVLELVPVASIRVVLVQDPLPALQISRHLALSSTRHEIRPKKI